MKSGSICGSVVVLKKWGGVRDVQDESGGGYSNDLEEDVQEERLDVHCRAEQTSKSKAI